MNQHIFLPGCRWPSVAYKWQWRGTDLRGSSSHFAEETHGKTTLINGDITGIDIDR